MPKTLEIIEGVERIEQIGETVNLRECCDYTHKSFTAYEGRKLTIVLGTIREGIESHPFDNTYLYGVRMERQAMGKCGQWTLYSEKGEKVATWMCAEVRKVYIRGSDDLEYIREV